MSSWIFPAAAVLAQLLCRFPAAVVVFPGRLSRRSISWITTRPDPDSFPNMMKLSLVVMAMMADAAKVRTGLLKAKDPCPEGLTNRFPDGLPKKIVLVDDENGGKAMNPMDSVFDLDALRAALKEDPEWKIGMPWLLKATFSSDSQVDRTFSFASGDTGGFLMITVPAGVQDKDIQVTDNIEISGADAEFQYKKPSLWTSGKIVMENICLAPRSCDTFECPSPAMKPKGKGHFGFSAARCCDMRMCSEIEGVCLPNSMYTKAANFSEKKGHDNSTCCSPKYCPNDLCKDDTKWVSKGDVVLGSTKEECCERLECATYTCSNPALMTKSPNYNEDGTPRYGSTDDECCAGKYCKGFDCQPSEDFGLKPGAANILGNSKEACCDVKKCDTFECPNNTKWKPNPAAVVGSTKEQCCTKIMCSSYTCSNEALQKKPGQATMQGSSDEECCEKKFCSAWTCSDPSKWVHLSNQHGATNLDRRGFSDEECCDKKFCLAETCDPATQWKAKEGLDKIQGSTKEQCCEKIYCDAFVCDTDVNNTGVGTQWYKRVDTNIYKWQGSTNEECCMPIFCSQYTTSHPTRWTRKKDPSAKGSTDVECYDPLLCSDYCCDKQAGLEHRPNAEHHQGSTDEDFVLFLHRSCGYPATQRPYNFIHLPWKQLAVVNFISHEECNFCFRVMKCLAGVPGVPVADVREGLHLGLEANLAHFCAKCCQMSSYETLPLVFVNNQEVPLKLACQSFVSDDLLMHFLEQLPGHKTKKTPMQKIPKAGKQPNKQHHNKMVPPGLAPLGLTKQGPNTLDLGYAPPQLDGLDFNALGPGGSTVVFSL